jgi:uncharacterized protein (TIGR03437 family)
MKHEAVKKRAWIVFLLTLGVPILVWAFAEGPPDAHTGGFREPTCAQCHGTGQPNTNGGRVTISLPQAYSSGVTYPITVTVFDSAQRRWGFELSARTSSGGQAGDLIPTDSLTQIASPASNTKIQYIEQTSAGTRSGTRDTGSGVSFTFNWTAPDVSAGPVVFNTAANAANGNGAPDPGDHIYTAEATLQPEAPGSPGPSVSKAGIVNNASFAPGTNPLAPGTLAAIFGMNLNDGTSNPSNSLGADGKLLTLLGGASVTFNGIPAPVFSSFPGQLNVQVPFELDGADSASVQVIVGGQASDPQTVPIGPFSPGIFAITPGGAGQGAVLIANTNTLAAPLGSVSGRDARPAKRGEFITIFCTGLGSVSSPPLTGQPASIATVSNTITTPQVSVGEVPAIVSFSGLAPGFIGLYQINVQIPPAAPTGDSVPLALTLGGIKANPLGTVNIAVAP